MTQPNDLETTPMDIYDSDNDSNMSRDSDLEDLSFVDPDDKVVKLDETDVDPAAINSQNIIYGKRNRRQTNRYRHENEDLVFAKFRKQMGVTDEDIEEIANEPISDEDSGSDYNGEGSGTEEDTESETEEESESAMDSEESEPFTDDDNSDGEM